MSFINDVRKHITSNAVKKDGVITPLAIVESGSSKKTSFTIRIAVPMVRMWDWIKASSKVKETVIQPAQVRGVSVFDNVIGVNPTLSTVPEEDVDNLSNLTDDGISLGSSEYCDDDTRAEVGMDEQVPGDDISVISFDDEEWAAVGLPLSSLTDDGISLGSSEDFDNKEWAAVGLPLSSIKKVGIVQRVKNILGSVIDFFVNPFKSKQTAPTLTMTDTHLGLVMSDDNDISSDRRRDHNNEGIFLDSSDSDSTSLDSSGGNLAVSFPNGHLKDINTEPQQHTTARELPAATLM